MEAVEMRLLAIVIAIFTLPFLYFSLLFWLGLGGSKLGTDKDKIYVVRLLAALGCFLAAALGIWANIRAHG